MLPGEFTLATWEERQEKTRWGQGDQRRPPRSGRGEGEAWAQASLWAREGGVGNNKLLSSFHR